MEGFADDSGVPGLTVFDEPGTPPRPQEKSASWMREAASGDAVTESLPRIP